MPSSKAILLFIFIYFSFFSCNKKESDKDEHTFFSHVEHRNFKMGFTTWSYGPTLQNVNETYQFISTNSDIYTEHFDNKVPWDAFQNNTALPTEYVDEVNNRANRRIQGKPLVLSVSLLNTYRNDLADDFNEKTPSYSRLDDLQIEAAYYKHLEYLINVFQPDYLVAAMEVNELKLNNPSRWTEFVSLFDAIKIRLKKNFPKLPVSASVSIHNLLANEGPDTPEIINFINQQAFAAISYYPFLHTSGDGPAATSTFDFIHQNIHIPIAFSETAYLAEDLVIESLNVNIPGTPDIQNQYLESLLNNAQNQNYLFITWFAHRDYDALWGKFPPKIQDLGKVWRDTGILDEDGYGRLSQQSWIIALSKN